eukprot:217094_1
MSVIKYNKVKEGIGCIKETLILLILGVSIGVLFGLSNAFPVAALIFNILTNSAPWIMALIPLYFPLHRIRTMEGGTLDPHASGFFRKPVAIKCDHPLLVFIESKQNYQLFFKYLSYCWATENLLFYQKVSVISHIISTKLVHKDTTDDNDVEPRLHPRNKFEFLTSLYVRYESLIEGNDGDAVEFDELRCTLHQMQQEIYDEFISDGAHNQINISYDTKQRLVHLLGSNANVNVFQSLNDFLHIFDDAVLEIFKLLSSMYSYQFRAFLRSEYETNNL